MKLKLTVVSALLALLLFPVASVNTAAAGASIDAAKANAASSMSCKKTGGAPTRPVGVPLSPRYAEAQAHQHVVEQITQIGSDGGRLSDQALAILKGGALHAKGKAFGSIPLTADAATQDPSAGSAGPPPDPPRSLQIRKRSAASADAWLFCNYGDAGYGLYVSGAGFNTAVAYIHNITGGGFSRVIGYDVCYAVAPCVYLVWYNPNEDHSVTRLNVSSTSGFAAFRDWWCSY
jgi:hypothetical protein